jgi:tRNA threonylcarbamoyladenosine biosynthesis protein TsaB
MKRRPDILILAFDSTTDTLTAAAGRGARVLGHAAVRGVRYAEEFLAALEGLLRKRRLGPRDVDVIAVGLGPGSFSGSRVGVTAAKTLAYALGKPLVGLSTLAVIAQNAEGAKGPVTVVRDARRGNVYAATYRGGACLRPPALLPLGEFLATLDPEGVFLGDALAAHARPIAGAVGRKGVLVRDPRAWLPDARRMIPLALERARRGAWDDCLALRPEYLYADTCQVTHAAR